VNNEFYAFVSAYTPLDKSTLASKGSFVNFGCVDVSNIAQEELSNYVIESLLSDEDAGRAGEALPEPQRIVLNQIHSSPLSLHALNPLHFPLKRR
jgi:hypothetical protein